MEVDFLQPFLDIKARTALANPGEVEDLLKHHNSMLVKTVCRWCGAL